MDDQWVFLSVVMIVAFVVVPSCVSLPQQPSVAPSPAPLQPATTFQADSPGRSAAFTLKVDSLSPGSALPDAYTCKGITGSPEVSWEGIPPGTKSLVLVLDDPDAPAGTFTHWVVFNIPPEAGMLSPGQPNAKVLSDGAQQGDSSAGSRGYYPPCPPAGTTHRYVFRLYAADMDITQPDANRNSIDRALNGHTLSKVELATTFGR